MEMEIEELRRQRDLANAQVDELRKKLEEDDQQVGLSLSRFSHTTQKLFINYQLVANIILLHTSGHEPIRISPSLLREEVPFLFWCTLNAIWCQGTRQCS